MLEVSLIFLNFCLIIALFRQIKSLKQKVYEISFQKELLTKQLIKELKSNLYVISAISSGIEMNLEYNKLNKETLIKSLKDISSNIKTFENKVKCLEKKLFE